MRQLLIPTLIASALVLQACSVSTGLVAPSDRPHIAPPDSYSTAPCRLPVALPPGAMTQRDIERYWGTDRLSLSDCATRHAELNKYIAERDAGLTGH